MNGVVLQVTPDGVEVQTGSPVNGRYVQVFPVDEFEGMLTSVRDEANNELWRREGVAAAEEKVTGSDVVANDRQTETKNEKPTLSNVIATLYEKGKEYASSLFGMKFFDVAETPQFMKELGITGEKFTIRYGVISRHWGKDNEHTLPKEVWEQLPKAIQHPFAITKYYSDNEKKKQKGYRLYTSLQLNNGSFVVVGVEVKNSGRDIEVNAINTIFGRERISDVHDELIYTSETITPEQMALLNENNPHQYPSERESSESKDTPSVSTLQENDGKNVTNGQQTQPQGNGIPVDEKTGEPVYEAVAPDVAWDAIVQEAEGDEAMAMQVVTDMVTDMEANVKKAKKAKVRAGATVREKLEAQKEHKHRIEDAEAQLEAWERIAGVKAARVAAAERAKIEAAQQAEAEQQQEADVPDFVADKPTNARERGFRMQNGHRVDRQEPIAAAVGKEVNVKFTNKVSQPTHVAVVDARTLQPSHQNGQPNVLHFLPEAQPKKRTDKVSVNAAEQMAAQMNPAEITSSVTAYTGAPSVNARGEIIQGNNRTAALKRMWQGYPEQAAAYKQYLMDHAAEYGLKPEDISAMEQPVLVNLMDVTDEQAIELGQYDVKDTESGGTERIKPRNVSQKMGDKAARFASILLRTTDEEASVSRLLDENAVEALKWLEAQHYITPTQYRSAFNADGQVTPDAKNDLSGILYQAVFRNGSERIEEMFNAMPAKAQRAILATAYRDFATPDGQKMLPEIQNSIVAFYELSQEEAFANAKNYEEARTATMLWLQQMEIDFSTGQSVSRQGKYTNFALTLAAMYKGQTQTAIQQTFNDLFDMLQGRQQPDLFNQNTNNAPRTLAEAIREVLNIEYDGTNGSHALGVNNETRTTGRQGSTTDDSAGEQPENQNESNDNPRRTERSRGQSRNDNKRSNDLPEITEISSAERTEMENRIVDWLSEENLSMAMGKTRDEIFEIFGNEVLPIAYIPTKFINLIGSNIKDQRIYCGKGYFIDHALRNHAKSGMQISAADVDVSKYLNIQAVLDNPDSIKETFVDGKRTVVFIKRIGRYFAELTQVEEAGKIVLHKSFFNQKKEPYAKLNDIRENETSSEGGISSISHAENQSAPAISLQSRGDVVSISNTTGKDTPQNSAVQTLGKENAETSLQSEVERAEAQTNAEPTEAQKEAGNYKKGRVKVGSFDVVIEQPRGSVRSGVDANGKAWETTMQNTYGYFGGTKGVDGDAIDVFLGHDLDGWDGSMVFVVDQYNPDGSFDEHKVMLGFNSQEEAEAAYFSNYEADWAKTHRTEVTAVPLADFNEWMKSSKRKTKAFAEYKVAKRNAELDARNRANEQRAEQLYAMAQEAETEKDFFDRAASLFEVTGYQSDLRDIYNGVKSGEIADARALSFYTNATLKPVAKEEVKETAKEDAQQAAPILPSGTIVKNNEAGGEAVAVIAGSEVKDGKRRYLIQFAPDLEAAKGKMFFGDKFFTEEELSEWLKSGRFTTLEEGKGKQKKKGKSGTKPRKHAAKPGASSVSKQEASLRDALVGVAQQSGLEVVVDEKAQQVLDEVNERARTMAFGEEYDYEKYPEGRVEPYLANKSVHIESAKLNHGFANFDEAKEWAKNHIVCTLNNDESGGKNKVKISSTAVNKYLSESAVAKSENKDVHLAVLKKLPEIIQSSVDVETTPDFKKDEKGVRKVGNEINKNVLIHRCYGAVAINGSIYRVKITLKEYKDINEANKAYSYEATKIELLAGTLANDSKSTTDPGTNNSISVANLLKDVEMSYRPGVKVLEESEKQSPGLREHRVLTADNGEPSNLPEKQWHEVRTEDFKNWFGDWQDSDEASQVVDENGEPLIVYHGTDADFSIFDRGFLGKNTDENASDEAFARTAHVGFWFSTQQIPWVDKHMPVYLNFRNPLRLDSLEEMANAVGEAESVEAYLNQLQSEGYDSIIVETDEEYGGTSYVALNPNQIKSATENVGTFSRANNDIRFFRTANGEAYGFTAGGKIYLDPRIATAETPIHEYAHLWADMIRSVNPEAWTDIVGLMKATPIWEEVKGLYPELKTDDEIADEVLAHYSGRRGAERLREAQQQAVAETGKSVFERAAAVAAIERVKQALAKFWKSVAELFHIRFTTAEEVADRVLADMLNGVNPMAVDRKGRSLAGIHNISEEKLGKALKMGGLANPSLAVIDMAQGSHEGYGEISLIAPSALIDKKKGENAGTFSGDAWTPMYPQVERQFVGEGSSQVYDELSKLPEPVRPVIRTAWNNYMDGQDADGLAYQFLYEKGMAPEMKEKPTLYPDKIHQMIEASEALEGEAKEQALLDAYIESRFEGSREKFNDYVATRKHVLEKKIAESPVKKGLFFNGMKESLDEINERGYEVRSLNRFVSEVKSDMRRKGSIDANGTVLDAINQVRESEELSKEYKKWRDGLDERYGIKEVLFSGYAPDGSRTYLPHTLENVSELMKQEGLAAATGWNGSFSKFAAGLMKNVGTLAAIRKQQGKLTPDHDKVEAFRKKWEDVYFNLGIKLNPGGSAFDDTGLYRLEEVVTKANPKAFAKKEYGVELEDEDVEQMKDMVKAIREEYPAMYFETKFERPVRLEEFAAAVVPVDASEETKEALRNAGITLYEYDSNKSGDRRRAMTEAVQSKGVRFQFVGERGAAGLDKAEEATTRLDNLGVAREMESQQKDAKAIKLATGWERGADGKWRYEIMDGELKKNPKVKEKATSDGEIYYETTLADILENEQLYRSYPILRTMPVSIQQMDEGVSGNYIPGGYISLSIGLYRHFTKPENVLREIEQIESTPEYKEYSKYFDNDMPDSYIGREDEWEDAMDEAESKFFESELGKRYKELMWGDKRKVFSYGFDETGKGVILHEVQHAIQHIEGFAQGGNSNTYREHLAQLKPKHDVWSWVQEFKDKKEELGSEASQDDVYYDLINEFKEDGYEFGEDFMPTREVFDQAFDLWVRGTDTNGYEAAYNEYQRLTEKFGLGSENNHYKQLSGEVEARNVQSRLGMTPEERRQSLAEDTEDVARKDQIFIMENAGNANSLGDSASFRERQKEDLEAVNARFNERILSLRDNPNQKNRVVSLGWAGHVLQLGEIADAEIILEYDKLVRKSKEQYKNDHPFDVDDILNLPLYINDPIAIFKETNKVGNSSQVILTELKKNGRNFIVVVKAVEQKRKGGIVLVVNNVTTLFPKEAKGIIYWFNQKKATYVNREKALRFIEALQNHSETKINSKELEDAAKVVENPETSQGSAENNFREGKGELSDDMLSYQNDPMAQMMGKPRGTKKQRAQFAERERGRMQAHAEKLVERLHLTNVEIVTDASQLEGKQRTAKGFYNKRTGKITIVVPNHGSTADVEQTLLHEAVAHYGLRQLFGEHFDSFLDSVYRHAEEGIRRKIAEASAKHGWNVRTATEEYLADLAERTDFENASPQWWKKIKGFFLDMLRRLGFEEMDGQTLTDNELRYVLWRSYENLTEPGKYPTFVSEARDVAKQHALQVGRFAPTETTGSRVAENGELSEKKALDKVNGRFNEQLERLTEKNADSIVFSLGRPSAVLQSAGVKDKPMKLYGNKVMKKMRKHGFALEELRDLPKAVAAPIAVFDNYGEDGNRSILTELRTQQGNFLVSVNIGKDADIDFNIVRSVFGKGNENVVDWINKGLATYINKEKALSFLSHQSAPIAATAANAGQSSESLSSASQPVQQEIDKLDTATKVVENFENPTVSEEKTAEDLLFRDGSTYNYAQVLARDRYERRIKSGMYQTREALQDSMLGLRTAMESILEAEGRKGVYIEDIDGFENAYLGENRLSSVNQAEAEAFAREKFTPLLERAFINANLVFGPALQSDPRSITSKSF